MVMAISEGVTYERVLSEMVSRLGGVFRQLDSVVDEVFAVLSHLWMKVSPRFYFVWVFFERALTLLPFFLGVWVGHSLLS